MALSEFALPAPRKGSIDILSGFGRGPETGIEIHRKIQTERAQKFKNYKSEVVTSHIFEIGSYEIEINGRMDGFFEGENPRIEEIKTSFNVFDLHRRLKEAGDEHPYCLQLKTYGYFYWLQHKKTPELTLHLVSSRDGESVDLTLKLNIKDYEEWLDIRLQELVIEAELTEKRIKRRKKTAKELRFPFVTPRAGQVELIATIEDGMKENRPMLIQAPTGLGKTVGVLYPTLRQALSRGQKVIYITPKNSQHAVAEDAIDRLQEAGANIKAMTLTAKSKMCFKNEPLCNPEYCEFAKDHYTKVAENKLLERLAKKRRLKARTFKKLATQFQVCPFELQLDAAHEMDAVICDYNYVFAPSSSSGRLVGGGFQQKGKPNLVIDEAHNLPARTMDYYSPQLSVQTLEKMRVEIQKLSPRFKKNAESLLTHCISVVKKCGPRECEDPCKINPPVALFLEQDQELRNFLSVYLKSDVEIQPKDVVLRLSFYWSEFTNILQFVNSNREEFFTTFHPEPATVKITCCDASEMLEHCYDDYDQVVGFSATLKPFNFYSQLTGLQNKNLKTAEFASPFPKAHRKLLVIPQISSKYSERENSYPRVAETIRKITALKRGNYFAFFPSFDFMERVLKLFEPEKGFVVMKQERSMKRDDIDEIIAHLSAPNRAHIVFAVQGGVFSEGVDYPGEMAIGAFVVGPPLPNFNLERENMREYYQRIYSSGFDYAYTYPAMAKAIQAAGRVIRSETDRGIIILMDNRFIQSSYAKSMPQDWFEDHPKELVSESILSDVTKFWNSENNNA